MESSGRAVIDDQHFDTGSYSMTWAMMFPRFSISLYVGQ